MSNSKLQNLTTYWPDEFKQHLKRFYYNKNVLVLGANGFLGSNCVLLLQQLGANISIVSRSSQSRVGQLAHKIYYGDLSSYNFACKIVPEQAIIFDFMGSTGAVQSNKESYINFKHECQPHLNVFSACAQFNNQAIIAFCSSRLVYGKPQFLPVTENHPVSPESLYAIHKVTLENYLRVFAKTAGLRSCILRLSNPYGPNMESKKNSYSILHIFIRHALQNKAIQIYGDGSQYRDYIHVRDVINAFLACPSEPSCHGETFNLSGKHKVSLKDAAQIITQTAQSKPLQFIDWPEEYKLVETGDYYASTKKLESTISLPEQFSFNSALQETIISYLKTRADETARIEHDYCN